MSGDYTKNTQGLRCYAATNGYSTIRPESLEVSYVFKKYGVFRQNTIFLRNGADQLKLLLVS